MSVRMHWAGLFLTSLWLAILANLDVTAAFEVPFSDSDYDRQICSGMWGGKDTYINGETITVNIKSLREIVSETKR
jgi:hypothetical protein